MKCEYQIAWSGPCGKENCAEHALKKCISCGEKATRDCDETGQFICGAPLCENCEHTITEDGTNGGIGFNAQKPPEGMSHHCKRSEQRYKPWYARKDA